MPVREQKAAIGPAVSQRQTVCILLHAVGRLISADETVGLEAEK